MTIHHVRKKKLLAISSGGGHWVQLSRLWRAFDQCDLVVATVKGEYRSRAPDGARFYEVPDATRWSRFALVTLAAKAAWILIRERPDIVVTTGAAPGLIALVMAKLMGAKTVWIDSIANAEAMSLSGQRARRFADLWLTQWPHLAGKEGPRFEGSLW